MAGNEIGSDELRGLLAVNRLIVSDLGLPVVLRRIVEAACELVHARHGALGRLGPDGSLSESAHVGLDEHAVARIASMDSCLAVPVRVRGEVFGKLYLAGAESGEFSSEDADLVTALATTAGIAIENARLFAQAQSRQTWLRASAQITRQLLSVEGEEPLRLIARQTRQLAAADLVTVVLPTPDGMRLMVEVASGTNAADLTGFSYPVENTYAGETFKTGRPALLADAGEDPSHYVHLREVLPVGPAMVVPLVGAQRMRGALVVGRVRGRIRFDEADLDMATTFANHAAVALELADARADQQRVLLLEDRDRIARDLHDHVIQQLFAAGLSVQSVASTLTGDVRAERLDRVVTGIDDTIRQIRTTIFQLRGPLGPRTGTVRTRLQDVVAELSAPLGFAPRLAFDGPVDALVPEGAIDDLVAVTREALTNVARHARAGSASVTLAAGSGALVLEISDDGSGIGDSERRSGLANLSHRAEGYGGSLRVGPVHPAGTDDTVPETRRGTRLTWTLPLH